MRSQSKKKRNTEELTARLVKIQSAILNLASIVDTIPGNEYPAKKEILTILGLKPIEK